MHLFPLLQETCSLQVCQCCHPSCSKSLVCVRRNTHPSFHSHPGMTAAGEEQNSWKVLLDRRTRWFWHIKVDMYVIGSLTSTTTLWCYRRWAAKHIGDEGTISSRAEAACASLQQPMPRGRWVLSRCQSLLAGQQCLASFFIGAFAGSETMFYFWTYNHRGILH